MNPGGQVDTEGGQVAEANGKDVRTGVQLADDEQFPVDGHLQGGGGGRVCTSCGGVCVPGRGKGGPDGKSMLYAGALRIQISRECERPRWASRDSGARTTRSVAARVGSAPDPQGTIGNSGSCSYIVTPHAGSGEDIRGVLSYPLFAPCLGVDRDSEWYSKFGKASSGLSTEAD